jgi:hypothetical protein
MQSDRVMVHTVARHVACVHWGWGQQQTQLELHLIALHSNAGGYWEVV